MSADSYSCDLAIVGSGFGGSLLAMAARRLGLTVLLTERGTHPRFAIGESTSPLMNLLIEQIAERYNLPRLLPLTTYGAWQRTYPEVVCGLKRGFTYFQHTAGEPYRVAPGRANQLLVAASPADEIADTHWLRADVDHFLLKEAVALGAGYLDETLLTDVERLSAEGATLRGTRRGQPLEIRARLVIDATGPRGFLSRALAIPETDLPCYPKTQALYSHFIHVRRCDQMPAYRSGEAEETPPYPMDDAAVHHLFDGGWMWALRFNNGVTSAGFACTDRFADEIGLSEGAPAWDRFLQRFPTIGEQFASAEALYPLRRLERLTYRAAQAAGDGWAMLPSAAAFVDPLFSNGMPLTLLGIERMGRILEEAWGTDALTERLQEYGRITLEEADGTARLIAGCYAAFQSFPLFAAYSMFYFAAASYSEMARRLGKSSRVTRYLARNIAPFREAMDELEERLQREGSRLDAVRFADEVARRIAPLNIAGLCDPAKRNWYGVDLNDLIVHADRLGFSPETMREIVRTAPWAQVPDAQTAPSLR
jgi:FADH2 O2-dependent halogenase